MNSQSGRRPKSKGQARFYIYISDAKVDMLFAQIPESLIKRIAAELTLDVKLLSIKVATREAPETRFSRVMAVTKYLRENETIGTVASRKTFVEAEKRQCAGVWSASTNPEALCFSAGMSASSEFF